VLIKLYVWLISQVIKMVNLKIPQSELGMKLNSTEKKRLTSINAGLKGSVDVTTGKIKKPKVETMY